MAKANRNSGNPWTTQELRSIKKMVREGMPASKIGPKLGRTVAALYMKASIEGISLARRTAAKKK